MKRYLQLHSCFCPFCSESCFSVVHQGCHALRVFIL
jgi:hypothetical protein